MPKLLQQNIPIAKVVAVLTTAVLSLCKRFNYRQTGPFLFCVLPSLVSISLENLSLKIIRLNNVASKYVTTLHIKSMATYNQKVNLNKKSSVLENNQ